MNKLKEKKQRLFLRRRRVRSVISGTATRPRLNVYRTHKHIYAQIIDDENGKTLASASDIEISKGKKSERAHEVGKMIAQKAKDSKITNVSFDRAGYKYHGRVKALAEGAREEGLIF